MLICDVLILWGVTVLDALWMLYHHAHLVLVNEATLSDFTVFVTLRHRVS